MHEVCDTKLKEMLATNCLRWRRTGEEKVLWEKSSLLLVRLTALATRIDMPQSFKLKPGPPRCHHVLIPSDAEGDELPPQDSTMHHHHR
jgi:hypothetical protein